MFAKKGPRDCTRKTEAGPALIFLPPCKYIKKLIKKYNISYFILYIIILIY